MVTELQPASREHEGFIRSLLDAYLEELSAYRQIPVGATDAERYPWLDAYWTEPGRHMFIIRSNRDGVGFAFVRDSRSTGSPASEIAEFYIEPRARRKGFGQAAVSEIFRTFPGSWELQVHIFNTSAIEFWTTVAQAASATPIIEEVSGNDGRRLQFNFTVK